MSDNIKFIEKEKNERHDVYLNKCEVIILSYCSRIRFFTK